MSFEEIDLQWFAAEDEGRTEEPTELKLQRAREEGRVAKSQEIASSLVLLLCVATLIALGPTYLRWCEEILVYFFKRCTVDNVLQPAFYRIFISYLLRMVLPLSALGAVAAVAANIVQNRGFIFSLKPIQPQFSKIVPRLGQYLTKTLFSFEGGFNFIKNMVKVAVIALVGYLVITSNVPAIMGLLKSASVSLALGKIASTAAKIMVICAIIFLIISIPDYIVQRRQFLESMKMSKQDIKQEYKEMEGDPEVKSHLEQAQRELLSRNMPRAVAESDVVITNPTHFAVSLKYEHKNEFDAPKVTAKGQDAVALRMREIARENDVPIVENKPVARELYAKMNVGDIIPEAYFAAIAAIYSQINTLNHKMS